MNTPGCSQRTVPLILLFFLLVHVFRYYFHIAHISRAMPDQLEKPVLANPVIASSSKPLKTTLPSPPTQPIVLATPHTTAKPKPAPLPKVEQGQRHHQWRQHGGPGNPAREPHHGDGDGIKESAWESLEGGGNHTKTTSQVNEVTRGMPSAYVYV